MHPTIIKIGPFAIRSYGLMLAIGFFAGIMLAAWRVKRDGENPDHVYNISIWLVISSLVGARLYYVISHFSEFRADENLHFLYRFFILLKNVFWPVGYDGQIGISGLVLYGGLILATLAAALYLYIHKLNVFKFMDYFAPSLGLGEFFTRIGCFLNGCCFGKPTESIFGMIFPENSAAGMFYPGIHIHSSQLYNSLAGLIIFIALITLERYKKFNGFTSLLYFNFYSLGRFIIDYSRYYESNLTVFHLSHNQIVSLFIFVTTTSLFIYFMKKASGKTKNTVKG